MSTIEEAREPRGDLGRDRDSSERAFVGGRVMSALTQAMTEYAQAIRGDWSDFDGRSERDVIESWVSEIEAPTDKTLEQWRDQLNICADGNGHWAGVRWGHCRESDCPTEWANEVRWRAEDEARKAAKEISDE